MVRAAPVMDRALTKSASMLTSKCWVSTTTVVCIMMTVTTVVVKPTFLQTLRDNMEHCMEYTTEFFCGSIQVAITRLPASTKPESTKNKGEPYVR